MFFAFFLWGVISVIAIVIGMWLAPENYVWNFKPVPFFILVFVSFVFLPFQTSFEEIVFRGYLMQGFGIAATKKSFGFTLLYFLASLFIYLKLNQIYDFNIFIDIIILLAFGVLYFMFFQLKIIDKINQTSISNKIYKLLNRSFTPLIITSAIFGLLHGMNPEVERLGYILMVFYIGTGLFYGIATLMDEGMELALGLHTSNNIIAAFLVTTDWMVFRTDALYVDTSEPAVGAEMYIGVFVLYPLLLLVFSKKYGWKNWKEKLFGKVERPAINEG